MRYLVLFALLVGCGGSERDSGDIGAVNGAQSDLLTFEEWCDCTEIRAADCSSAADPIDCFADLLACPSLEKVSFSCKANSGQSLMVACFDISTIDGLSLSEVCD